MLLRPRIATRTDTRFPYTTLFRSTFPVEAREVRWHPAFDPFHQEERFIKHSSRPFHESYVGHCSVGVFPDRLHEIILEKDICQHRANGLTLTPNNKVAHALNSIFLPHPFTQHRHNGEDLLESEHQTVRESLRTREEKVV